MKVYIKEFVYLLISILFFFSCRKMPANNTTIPGQVYSFYDKPYIQNTAGEILFQVNNLANDPGIKKLGLLFGGFSNVNNTVPNVDGTINIGGYNIVPNTNELYNLGYDSLYGKIISYNIKPPSNEGSTVLTGTFYSPAPIYATNIPLPNQTQNYIPAGSPFSITWKADANNTNGVNIEADYYPNSFQNWDLAAKGDSTYLQNSIMLPDNGSAELPVSFFTKFPKGANLLIFIGRGNAVYVQSGQYIYLLNGFFRSSFFAVKK